jgi:hypothetical protein
MAQTKFGQTDALALVVADYLNSLNSISGALCTPIAAERRFALVTDLALIPEYDKPASVDIFPDVEDTERVGFKNFNSQYAIHLYIQRKTDGTDEEAACALLTQLRSEIIEKLKTVSISVPDAVHPIQEFGIVLLSAKSADRSPGNPAGLYNLARLLQSHVYESDTILVFKVSS